LSREEEEEESFDWSKHKAMTTLSILHMIVYIITW